MNLQTGSIEPIFSFFKILIIKIKLFLIKTGRLVDLLDESNMQSNFKNTNSLKLVPFNSLYRSYHIKGILYDFI